jgi:MGT family glycosyltransferase
MKALFFGLPVYGHVNPTLPLIRELSRRGDDIIYLSTAEFEPRITATGARFRAYRNGFLPELGTVARRLDELAWLLMRTTSELLADELSDYRAARPDYVITDSVAQWGHWIGEILDVPVITSVSTFAFNRHVIRYGVAHGVRPRSAGQFLSKLRHILRAARLMGRLRRTYGAKGPGLMPMSASALSLVYTSRDFQPRAETFDDRFCFVGPLFEPRAGDPDFPWAALGRRRVVYVSLGTLFNDALPFYRICFEALKDVDAQIVLSAGSRISLDELGTPPPNMLVRTHVPQIAVLERTAAFVTHGGMNSVSESLFNAVPVVVIPQMSEQEIVGRRVEELGAGVFLAKHAVTADRLRASVERILSDESYALAARRLADSLRAAGGAPRAADAVQALVRSQQMKKGGHEAAAANQRG